jgi:hypothetical protein
MPEEEQDAVLFGGPLDGHRIKPRLLPFIWVGPEMASGSKSRPTGSIRVFTRPGKNRLLYRRLDDKAFAYAHLTHRACTECDQIQPPTDDGRCGFCGHTLIRPARLL